MGTTERSGKLRTLLVSDNRDNDNWGSRATTAALLDTLSASGLSPQTNVSDLEVRRTTPIAVFRPLDRALTNSRLTQLAAATINRGERSSALLAGLFGITDAVSDDPSASVAGWRSRQREPFTGWRDEVANVDLVIVNGEGSMVFSLPARREQRFHLAVMQLALESGVPYAYVNALVSDPPTPPLNERTKLESTRLLQGALRVTARDEESASYLADMSSDIPATFVPDALFTWHGRIDDPALRGGLDFPDVLKPFVPAPERLGIWRFDRPYLCIGGSATAAHDVVRARDSYGRLVQRLRRLGLPIFLTASARGDGFLESIARDAGLPYIPPSTNVWAAAAILANAAAVITGRYHPAILAGLGGTPSVMLNSDSHKTASVQRLLGYPETVLFPTFPEADDADAIARQVEFVLAERAAWSQRIRTTVAQRAAHATELGPLLRDALQPTVA